MSSDRVRIEIAERMRGPFDVCEYVGHTHLSSTLFGMQVCAKDELELRNGMRYLAELIDPTCKPAVDDAYGMDDELVCSECGCCLAITVDGKPSAPLSRYCPCCGARIVEK